MNFVVFAPNPWHDIWRNRQQIFSRLAGRHRVLYIEPARASLADWRRSRVTLADLRRPAVAKEQPNLWLYRIPAALPSRDTGDLFDRTTDRLLAAHLRRTLRPLDFLPSPQPPVPTPYPPHPTPHWTVAPGNCCCICARRSWGCRVIWASTTADSWSAGGRWLRSCRWNRPAWRRARWCSGTRSRWRMPVSSRSTCWGCGCCRCWKKRRDGWEKREGRGRGGERES